MQSPIDVEIGKEYMVPCIFVGDEFMPVIGDSHIDPEADCVNPIGQHYHIDKRFLKDDSTPIKNEWDVYALSWAFVESRKLKCYRQKTSITKPYFFHLELLYRRFQNSKTNGTCPHHGLPLVNKCGTCPGHGLKWNLKTNQLDYKLPFSLKITLEDGTILSGEIRQSGYCRIKISKTETIQLRNVIFDDIGHLKRIEPRIKIVMVDANDEVVCDVPIHHLFGKNNQYLNLIAGAFLEIKDTHCFKKD